MNTPTLTPDERRILRQCEGNLAHARKTRASWRVMAAMVRAAAIQLEEVRAA